MENNQSSFILFKTEDEKISVDVRFEEESVWLLQEQMATLFERDRSVIVKHIAKIFSEGELEEKSNVQFLHIANSDKPVKFYNLNVIISVGYRVKSQRGTQFRIWATKRLNEYIRKSFRKAMSQANRLKVDLKNCTYRSPTFFVSGETESENMHNSHQVLSKKIPNSECAFYPGKGHAWMVSDISTHIQLVKYWFLNDTFPVQLKSF